MARTRHLALTSKLGLPRAVSLMAEKPVPWVESAIHTKLHQIHNIFIAYCLAFIVIELLKVYAHRRVREI
jgi:hypothetical protein